jgi:hypothetical protein
MQKKLKSLFMVASLLAAATLVFIACGSGDVLQIPLVELKTSEDAMYARIEGKDSTMFQGEFPAPEPPPPSSEAEPPPVSSGENPIPLSSSEYVPPPPPPPGSSSSSYVIQLPSSSSVSTSAPSSSSSKPAQTVSGCKESNPKSGVTCGWSGYTATATLTPGTMLKPATFTPPSGCSSVAWKFAPDTAGMILNYECEELPDGGVAALGSKNYVLFAELTCDDGKHTTACNPAKGWSSKIAPTLTGECKWSKNPTTTARGGTPVKDDNSVKVIDTDHVCSSPTVVYKYADGTKDWPATGILSEWKTSDVWKDKKHEETYNVEATLNCPAYPQLVTTTCPPLKVSAGSDYIIECTGKFDDASCGGAAKKTVTLKVDECVEINVMGYTDQYNTPEVIMRCETQGTQQSASVTMALNGKATTTTGSYSVQPLVSLGKIKVGDNEFGTLCVTALSGATGVKCTGPSQ